MYRTVTPGIRHHFFAIATVFALLVTTGIALAPQASAKGSTLKSARWTASRYDATYYDAKAKPLEFRVNIRDKTPIASAGIVIESGLYGYKSVNLYLKDGSNRNGMWSATPYFDSTSKGTWRVTQIWTRNQDGYTYTLKKDRGIGGKLKVSVGAKTKIKVIAPKSVVVGKKARIRVQLTARKRAVKSQIVQMTTSWVNAKGKYKSKTRKVRTNKKGIGVLTIKMPASAVSVGAWYQGRKWHYRSAYKGKSIGRKYIPTSLALGVCSARADAGTNCKVSATLKVKKGKKYVALKNKSITVSVTGWNTSYSRKFVLKTNKSGKATGSFQMPSDTVSVYASWGGTKVQASQSKSVKVALNEALSLKLSNTRASDYYGCVTATITRRSFATYGYLKLTYWDSDYDDFYESVDLWGNTSRQFTVPFCARNWEDEDFSTNVQAVWVDTLYSDWPTTYAASNTVSLTVPGDDW